MTAKKVILIVSGIVVALVLLVLIFVGAIVGIAFYSVGHNEAAQTAKAFLKSNEKLRSEIGEIKDFGNFVSGSVNTENSDGTASLSLKVIGEKKTLNSVTVDMMYKNGRSWHVTGARYTDDSGRTVELLDPFNTPVENESQL